jgi:predicted enzyme related to lactoylglutathione lyase
MKKIPIAALALNVVLLLSSAVQAQTTLREIRIGAQDTVALAKFYETTFGMQEVNRVNAPKGPEILLNFGTTADEAKANSSPRIVIAHRESDEPKDPIMHIILNVKDMMATISTIKAAGGSMDGDPRPFRNTGMIIGMAIDPAGNHIELIQNP